LKIYVGTARYFPTSVNAFRLWGPWKPYQWKWISELHTI